jgi:hypothetical protein
MPKKYTMARQLTANNNDFSFSLIAELAPTSAAACSPPNFLLFDACSLAGF